MTKEAIAQEDGTFLNEAGAVVNDANHLIDEDGKLINDEGFLVNDSGQLLNDKDEAVDAEGNLIDAEGKKIEAAADNDDGKMIPKHRYDSAAKRAKKAEAALLESEQKRAAEADTDGGPRTVKQFEKEIDALDNKIEAAQADNDSTEAAKLSKEQRILERAMYTEIAKVEAKGTSTMAQQEAALDTLIDKLEEDHDTFNPDSKDFDQGMVDEVVSLQKAFVTQGDTPAQAMAKAVGYILPDTGKKDGGGKRKTDVNKNLDAAKRQPGKMGADGKDSPDGGDTGDAGDISKMSTEEFDALPADTKKRLRGDAYVA